MDFGLPSGHVGLMEEKEEEGGEEEEEHISFAAVNAWGPKSRLYVQKCSKERRSPQGFEQTLGRFCY